MPLSVSSAFRSVFAELDRRVEERWMVGNLSHGFWRSGAIPLLKPDDTLRKYGFWQAKAELTGGMSGRVSVALIGGHTRIGLFLPAQLLEKSVSNLAMGNPWALSDLVSKAHDGQPASIYRRLGGHLLFDRIFTDAPFSAEWLLRCAQDAGARNILENHLAWRVIDIWESAIHTLLSRQHEEDLGPVIHSNQPLPSSITESLPMTFQDVYEIQPGHWVTILTPDSCRNMKNSDLEAQLQALLPNYGITMQKDV